MKPPLYEAMAQAKRDRRRRIAEWKKKERAVTRTLLILLGFAVLAVVAVQLYIKLTNP